MRRLLVLLSALALVLSVAAPVSGATSPTRGWLVATRAPLTGTQIRQLKRVGATVVHAYRHLPAAAIRVADSKLGAVKALGFVRGVSRDGLKQTDAMRVAADRSAAAPNAVAAVTPYWLDMMNAESIAAGDAGYDGTGVWVGVLDSVLSPIWQRYLDPAHVRGDLGRSFQAAGAHELVQGWDNSGEPHGTAVSATIVGYTLHDERNIGGFIEGQTATETGVGTYQVPGVAPGAQIIPLNVCLPIGCFESAIFAGYDYLIGLKKAHPAQPIVVNESLGGATLSALEKTLIDRLIAEGIILVASAGNSGTAGMGFPAAYAPVISSGAVGWTKQWEGDQAAPNNQWTYDDVPENAVLDGDTANDQLFVADFSSREKAGQDLDVLSNGRHMLLPYPCPQLYQKSWSGTSHGLCAGSNSANANAGVSNGRVPQEYIHISGTSFSAPALTGIVARMLDKNPTLTAAQVEAILESAAATATVTPTSKTFIDREMTELRSETHTWAADAVGSGYVFLDAALAATPAAP